MKGFKKFLVFLYFFITGLFFLALVVGGIAQTLGIFKVPGFETLDNYFTVPSLIVTGAVFFVFSVFGFLLIPTLTNKRGIAVVRRITPEGDVNISSDAIKTITQCTIEEFDSIQLDETGVLIKDNTVDIFIKVFVTDSNKVTETVIEMQYRVKETIENNMDIEVNNVRILINDIKNENSVAIQDSPKINSLENKQGDETKGDVENNETSNSNQPLKTN